MLHVKTSQHGRNNDIKSVRIPWNILKRCKKKIMSPAKYGKTDVLPSEIENPHGISTEAFKKEYG